MLGLIEKVVLFLMSLHLGYKDSNRTLRHAFFFFIFCMLAVPLDYLLYLFSGFPYLPPTLKESLATNLFTLGIMLIGLGLGGTLQLMSSKEGKKMKGKVGVFRERKDCVLRVRVPRRLMMELRRTAKRKGRHVSELVRRAIHEMLREERKENVLHSKQ